MNKATHRKLKLEPVKKSSAAGTAGSFRARSAAASPLQEAGEDHGVKASAGRAKRFQPQPVEHN
jgi:hypothetical protein